MTRSRKKYHIPPGYSLLQTLLSSSSFLKDPIAMVQKNMALFSGTYSVSLGIRKKLIMTQDPGFINYVLKDNHKNYQKSSLATEKAVPFFGNGLLFSNGEYWLHQRRLMQPAFHKEKLKALNNIVSRNIEVFLQDFPEGKNIDISPPLHRLSFNILLQSIFDIDLSAGLMDEIGSIFGDIQQFMIKDTNQLLRKFTYPFTKEKSKLLLKSKRLREIFKDIINERVAGDKKYSDLLDMLLNSKYEDTGEPMSQEQIIDELIILVFAGHETTATTLSWLLYLLSQNKPVLDKLCASFAGASIEESLQNEYMKAVIQEGMRLYPAAWMTERAAITDDSFGDVSYAKDTIIISFFLGLHRDEKLWDEPLQFIPERFMGEASKAKSKNYFAFGAGPRMCIGNHFAMIEMIFFLYLFFKNFSIEPTAQVPQMKPLMTLNPDKVVLDIYRVK